MIKVFLIEDEIVIREALERMIPWKEYGFELVGKAKDGEIALPMIRKSKPDVLITDIKMPFMDGLTLSSIVKKEFPNISLGTVYRNLSLLSEIGEIQKLSTGIGPDRFDGNPAPHYHFICNHCGSVLDLDVTGLDHINVLASQNFDGEIEGHLIYFYGKCPDCKKTFGAD